MALGTELAGTDPDGVHAALDRYDAQRRPRTSALITLASRVNRMATLKGSPAMVRNTVLRLVPSALATRALVRQMRPTR